LRSGRKRKMEGEGEENRMRKRGRVEWGRERRGISLICQILLSYFSIIITKNWM